MRLSFTAATFAVASLFIFTGGVVLAQSQQVTLPSAGLTPDSPFYFLDRLGENIQQFFTFGAEAKAKLQIEFAGERIAEIKVMVERKGPQDKGIDKAKELLVGNVAYVAETVNQEKASGKDVAKLAKEIDDEFDARDKLLVQIFLDARGKLIAQHKEIKDKLLKDAQAAGDTTKVAELTQQLNDVQNQANDLKDKKDEIKNSFRNEKKKIEQNMNQEDQQEDQNEQNQEDHQEMEQEGEQGEFELEQEGEQGETELKQEGEQEELESEQAGEQGKTELEQEGEVQNQTGTQETDEQESTQEGMQGTSTQEE